jgi:hypothetical protein
MWDMIGINIIDTMLNIPNNTFDINPINGFDNIIFDSSTPITYFALVVSFALACLSKT